MWRGWGAGRLQAAGGPDEGGWSRYEWRRGAEQARIVRIWKLRYGPRVVGKRLLGAAERYAAVLSGALRRRWPFGVSRTTRESNFCLLFDDNIVTET